MTEQDKERIFEQYCKLEHALRIAKDALIEIKCLPEFYDTQVSLFAARCLTEIDEVLNERE